MHAHQRPALLESPAAPYLPVKGKPIDDLIVAETNQEHGVIASRSEAQFDISAFPVETRLCISLNHACATAAQYAAYEVIASASTEVVAP